MPILVIAGLSGSARGETKLQVRARARLVLDDVERTGNGARVRGRLVDTTSDEGIAGKLVSIELGESTADATTDEKGAFTVELAGLGERVAARFRGDQDCDEAAPLERSVVDRPPSAPHNLPPDAPPRREASGSLSTRQEPSLPPVALGWYLAPPLATLLALLVGALVRWSRGGSRQRRAPRPVVRAGVVENRSVRLATLLPAREHSVDGVVWDVARERSITTAVITIAGAATQRLVVDAAGRFAIELPPGAHDFTVSAEGFLDERFTRSVPHRGELRRLRVGLVPIAARILELHREAARPQEIDDGTEQRTPRELQARSAIAGPAADALAQLTTLAEEAWWSPRASSHATLDEALALFRRCARAD